MTDQEFRVLLSLWMVSDPWPLSEKEGEVFTAFMGRKAKRRGYAGVVDACHRHMSTGATL